MREISAPFARTVTVGIYTVAAIVAVSGIYAYRNLEQRVTELRHQEEVLKADVEATSAQRDSFSSALTLIKNASLGYEDHVVKVNDILSKHCQPDTRVLCERYWKYGELLNYRQHLLIDRAVAKTPQDFGRLISQYEGMRILVKRVPWFRKAGAPPRDEQDRWLAAVNEGAAYSLWRLNRAPEALPKSELALQAAPMSAVIVSTNLKVACSLGADGRTIRMKYKDYLRRLNKVVADSEGVKKRDAQLNLELFQNDGELRRACVALKEI